MTPDERKTCDKALIVFSGIGIFAGKGVRKI